MRGIGTGRLRGRRRQAGPGPATRPAPAALLHGLRACASCSSPRPGSAMPCCPPGCWTTCCAPIRRRGSPSPAARSRPGCSRACRGGSATLVVEKRRYDLHWLALWRARVGTRWDLAVDLRGSALTCCCRPGGARSCAAGGAGPPARAIWRRARARSAAAAGGLDRRRRTTPGAAALLPRGPAGDRARPDRELGRQDLAGGALRRAVPRPAPGRCRARAPAVFAGPGAAERAHGARRCCRRCRSAIDLCGRLSPAGGGRLPRALRACSSATIPA